MLSWMLLIHVCALTLAGLLAATWGRQLLGLGSVSLSSRWCIRLGSIADWLWCAEGCVDEIPTETPLCTRTCRRRSANFDDSCSAMCRWCHDCSADGWDAAGIQSRVGWFSSCCFRWRHAFTRTLHSRACSKSQWCQSFGLTGIESTHLWVADLRPAFSFASAFYSGSKFLGGTSGGQSRDSIALDASETISTNRKTFHGTVHGGSLCQFTHSREWITASLAVQEVVQTGNLGGSGVDSWLGLRIDEQWQRIERGCWKSIPCGPGCSETTFVKNLGASSTWKKSRLQVRELPTSQLRSQCFRIWPQRSTRTTRKTLCVTRSKCRFGVLCVTFFFELITQQVLSIFTMSCGKWSLRICNKWWRMENGKRLCWHMVPATTEQWNDFPLFQKQKWQSLKYSLARGSRP